MGANSGFSLDVAVCIAGQDRTGLERLLRSCVRAPFTHEWIEQVNEDQIVYRLPEPQREGRTVLSLTPLALIDHRTAIATATTMCWHPMRRYAWPPPTGASRT